MNIISGKEALIALANGEEVQCKNKDLTEWGCVSTDAPLSLFLEGKNRNGFHFEFRLKPRTVTINGIEVPASSRESDYKNQAIWILDSADPDEYRPLSICESDDLPEYWWRTEEEIKQVVAALRKVFKEPQQ